MDIRYILGSLLYYKPLIIGELSKSWNSIKHPNFWGIWRIGIILIVIMFFLGNTMKPKMISYWNSFLIFLFTVIEEGLTVQHAFLEIENPNLNSISHMKRSISHRVFHQCSMDTNCRFVVLDANINEYKLYTRKSDLPTDKQNIRIWESECKRVSDAVWFG